MYLPRLYLTCLTLLSKLSGKEKGRTYYTNIQTMPFFEQRVYKQEKKVSNKMKKINYYMDITIIITLMKMCQSCVLTPQIHLFCYYIIQVHTKSSGKFNFLHYFFDNIALLLCKHPWNWVYINLVSIAMKLDAVFHCMVAFLNVFASFHNFIFLPP